MNAALMPAGLSTRTQGLPASPIRALLDAHRGPDTLDLGGGIPDPTLFPNERLALAAEQVLRLGYAESLQYAKTAGLDPLRELIAGRLNKRGFAVDREQIVITHGSQQAIATVAQILAERGSIAALEQPVYPGAIQAFSFAEATLLGLPVTHDGWDHDAIADFTPRLIYVIAHHHNPTGRCATLPEKQRLAESAERRGFYVVEDDAYGELSFNESLTRPLVADCPNYGILVGSFSKTLCPGLRLGYVACPKALCKSIEKALQATSLQPGTLTQHLAYEVLTQLDYDAHLRRLREVYEQRACQLGARLRSLGVEIASPRGGFFIWAKTQTSATEFVMRARDRGLLAVPESAFRAPGLVGPDEHLRLAFSRYRDDDASQLRLRIAFGGKDVL